MVFLWCERHVNSYDEDTVALMQESYENILRNAKSLSPAEQLRLISDLAEHLRTHGPREHSASILELQGLGKKIWQGMDAQEYVDRERASWNG